jgi:hypothetical protein
VLQLWRFASQPLVASVVWRINPSALSVEGLIYSSSLELGLLLERLGQVALASLLAIFASRAMAFSTG